MGNKAIVIIYCHFDPATPSQLWKAQECVRAMINGWCKPNYTKKLGIDEITKQKDNKNVDC